MPQTIVSIQNLSKYYRLGVVGSGTLREDLNRWWARARGKPDPLLKVGGMDAGKRKDGQIWALRDVDLDIKRGEILGIIGRNGAGKSTLLKILSRITAPTSGRVIIRGRVGSLLEVGTGFHPELTGRENIYLNGTILGMKKDEVARKFDEIVEFSEISPFIDTPVKRYSSGMSVRLAFAVAAHLDPEIMIVDEVLAVGDAAFQQKCLGKIGTVATDGRTVLFVSHNMGSVAKLCRSCVWLDRGSVRDTGSPESIIPRYLATSTFSTGSIGFNETESRTVTEAWIESVQILKESGSVSVLFTTMDPVVVRINVSIESLLPEIGVSIRVAKLDGTTVIHSVNLVDDTPREFRPGRWSFDCRIPPNTLNRGMYSVSVFADIPYKKWISKKEDILTFEVAPHGPAFRRYPPNVWQGACSPAAVTWHEQQHSAVGPVDDRSARN